MGLQPRPQVLCPPPPDFPEEENTSEQLFAQAHQLVGHLSPALFGLHSSRERKLLTFPFCKLAPEEGAHHARPVWKPGWGGTGQKRAGTVDLRLPSSEAGSQDWPSMASGTGLRHPLW